MLRPRLGLIRAARRVPVAVRVASVVVALSCEREPREETTAVFASAEIAASAPSSTPAPSDLPPLRVVESGPTGSRVRARRPVTVRLSRDTLVEEREPIERTVAVLPPGPTRREWRDARTLVVAPEGGWAAGRRHQVELGGEGTALARTSWSFRARVPRPARVVAGGGARVILTFDDAPARQRQADELLDLLRRLEVRALFFPTGSWARARPDWIERAVREGHRVCNHTLSHVALTSRRMTDEDVRREIEAGATDGSCRLFRPPLMALDERVERLAGELGWDLFLWDVDPRDWDGLEARDLVHLVLGRVRPDAVVLLHVHAPHTAAALPELADRLRRAGYVLSWDPADARGDAGAGDGGGSVEGSASPSRRWAEVLRGLDGGAHGPASPSSLP